MIELMNAIRRNLFKLLAVSLPVAKAPADVKANSADNMGRDLRKMFLSTTAASMGIKPTVDYPRVYGVAIDWPVGDNVATIVSMSDGSASLYTTSTFGIIGGAGHESVRNVARDFVRAANSSNFNAASTSTYPYPSPGNARFYFLTFSGVQSLEVTPQQLTSGDERYAKFFGLGQVVLTELRKVTEKSR